MDDFVISLDIRIDISSKIVIDTHHTLHKSNVKFNYITRHSATHPVAEPITFLVGVKDGGQNLGMKMGKHAGWSRYRIVGPKGYQFQRKVGI